MPDDMVGAVAAAFLAARAGAEKLSRTEADKLTLTTGEAYAVQQRVAERLGLIGGFKFAHRPGEAAIMAPIQAADIHVSPVTVPAGGEVVGIELEVGFRIRSALPDPQSLEFRDRLRESVVPLAAIELVKTRLADPNAASSLLRLADHQLNGGLVTGGGPADWDRGPLSEVEAHLTVDGRPVVTGPVRLPFGDAFDCLVELARMVGTHCGGLRPGQIVITGSLNGLPWLPPGTRVRGRIDGIGEVAVELAG